MSEFLTGVVHAAVKFAFGLVGGRLRGLGLAGCERIKNDHLGPKHFGVENFDVFLVGVISGLCSFGFNFQKIP
jgi:hypothetical protein